MLPKYKWVLNRTETIDFKEFMNREKEKPVMKSPKTTDYRALSIAINPLAFFDPLFLSIAAGIVVLAVVEKTFADSGLVSIAKVLSDLLNVAFPVVAFVALIIMINMLGIHL